PGEDLRSRRAAADRRDQRRENARVPLPGLPRRRLCGGGARRVSPVRVEGVLAHVPAKWPPVRRQGHAPMHESGASAGLSGARGMMQNLSFDIAHLLAGTMLVLSFLLLYQDRVTAVLNVFALQAIVLALSVAWQSIAQNAPHLIVTALVALVVKGFIIP